MDVAMPLAMSILWICAIHQLLSPVQSCFWSFSPAVEKNASVLESGDHAGSASLLSPIIARLTIVAGEFSDVSRTYVCLDVVAAVDCTHATFLPSGERATSL